MKLIPLAVLVTEDTFHALNDYVTETEGCIRMDAPDVNDALDRMLANNGWTPTMLIAGSLIARELGTEAQR